ncbi:class IV adenylate cyclase [Mucisphaera sp.]|uniref:class IV adenylate cyclase n=1 Tax=Mucisphaera sp. TaxID=2913024 RepID=UPI003D14BDD8
MAIEIEAKMKAGDVQVLRSQLKELGAKCLGRVLETNTYFDTHDQRLKAGDQGLRIRLTRSENGTDRKVYLTHKGPRSHGGLKRRSEAEVEISSAEDAADLLVGLGYIPRLTFEKRRETWKLGVTDIMIDEIPMLGSWIEIEGDREEDVVTVREQLGLDNSPLVKASYVAMLRSHAIEHGLPEEVFRFQPAETATT